MYAYSQFDHELVLMTYVVINYPHTIMQMYT